MERNEFERQLIDNITVRKAGLAWRRRAAAVAVAGGLVAGGFAISHGGGSTTVASASPSVSTLTSASSVQPATGFGTGAYTAAGNKGGRAAGHGFDGGRFGGRGEELTVTAVSGNTITATGRRSQSIAVTVSTTTTYTEAQAAATLSDVRVGSEISVQGTRSSNTAIAAKSIEIVLPTERGVVTAVQGSTLSVTGFDGATSTITLTSSTRYQMAGQTTTASAITTGTAIVAEGTTASDGTLTASLVTVQLPRVSGQVTAASNGTYTLSSPFGGTSRTVTTSSSTVFVTQAGAAAQASAITTGTRISAEGTLSSDGKTLAAQRIVIMPAASSGTGAGGSAPQGPGQSSTGATA